MKPEHERAVQPELLAQRRIGHAADGEFLDVHRVGDDRDLCRPGCRAPTISRRSPSQIVVTASARCSAQVSSAAAQAVAQAAFARGAVIDRGVLPERPHLVDHRDAQPPADPQRGHRVQHRRVRVQDVRPHAPRDLLDAVGDLAHQLDLRQARHALQDPARGRRAVEVPAVDVLLARRRRPLLRAR